MPLLLFNEVKTLIWLLTESKSRRRLFLDLEKWLLGCFLIREATKKTHAFPQAPTGQGGM